MSSAGMAMAALKAVPSVETQTPSLWHRDDNTLHLHRTIHVHSAVQTLAIINPRYTPVGKISIITYSCDSAGNYHRWASTDWLLS